MPLSDKKSENAKLRTKGPAPSILPTEPAAPREESVVEVPRFAGGGRGTGPGGLVSGPHLSPQPPRWAAWPLRGTWASARGRVFLGRCQPGVWWAARLRHGPLRFHGASRQQSVQVLWATRAAETELEPLGTDAPLYPTTDAWAERGAGVWPADPPGRMDAPGPWPAAWSGWRAAALSGSGPHGGRDGHPTRTPSRGGRRARAPGRPPGCAYAQSPRSPSGDGMGSP